MVEEMGRWLEEHPQLPDEIRAAEESPEGTRVLVASLGGVNVLLAEPGAKTFKAQFERELADAEVHLEEGVKKLLLCDGARSLSSATTGIGWTIPGSARGAGRSAAARSRRRRPWSRRECAAAACDGLAQAANMSSRSAPTSNPIAGMPWGNATKPSAKRPHNSNTQQRRNEITPY